MTLFVVDATTRQRLPGIPTPRLCDEASRAFSVEAYWQDGVWFARADGEGFVSPTGAYTKVRVEHAEDYRVDVSIKVIRNGEVEDAYDDYFIVEARDEREAFANARSAVAEDMERRLDDDTGYEMNVIRAQRGVSI